MMYLPTCLFFGIFFAAVSLAGAPDWVKQNSFERQGSKLRLVCHGTGPSLELARRESINQCLSTVSEQANGYFKLSSLSVSTEKSAAYHEEISRDVTVSNLICNPLKEESAEANGSWSAWIRCEFDLAKAKVHPVGESARTKPESIENDSSAVSIEFPKAVGMTKAAKYLKSTERLVSITTTPRCQSILVTGNHARTIACKDNPVGILVYQDDVELIVRATGYQPKHVKLNESGRKEPLSKVEVFCEKD
jgi:hypothetical protein